MFSFFLSVKAIRRLLDMEIENLCVISLPASQEAITFKEGIKNHLNIFEADNEYESVALPIHVM